MTTATLDEKRYTPAEAAPKLRVGVETVWRWIRSGKIKATKGRRPILIPESEIEKMVEAK